jgi:transporter family-2 protein
MALLALVAAFVAGALITVQTASNAQLKEALGHPVPSVIISSSVGVAVLVVVMLVAGISMPSLADAARAPWWAWVGGLVGAVYALTVVLLAHQLGAATLMALVVTGQLVCSVALDHFGVVGFEQHSAGLWRIVGCVLMLAGLGLIWRF